MAELNELVRELQARKVHVHLSNGHQLPTSACRWRVQTARKAQHRPSRCSLLRASASTAAKSWPSGRSTLDIVDGHGWHHHHLTVAGTDRRGDQRGRSTWASEVQSTNERRGPLFLLRESSLDELSQLFNVLLGKVTGCSTARRCRPASPVCGRSRPATSRASPPIAGSICSTSTTGRSRQDSK
jgi:hypothetical protein